MASARLPSTNWYPSGGDFATRAEPTIPPAPPTFSMTTCWPRTSDSRRPMMRPNTSVPPPAANGTTIVTGRVGQLWAAAGLTPSRRNAEAAKANRIVRLASMVYLTLLVDSKAYATPATASMALMEIRSSAADLKFLYRLRQTHFRNFKSKSGTRIVCWLVPLLLPKFVSEGAAMDHELRKRGTSKTISLAAARELTVAALAANRTAPE